VFPEVSAGLIADIGPQVGGRRRGRSFIFTFLKMCALDW